MRLFRDQTVLVRGRTNYPPCHVTSSVGPDAEVGDQMGWFEKWQADHSVVGATPISELSAEAKADLLAGAMKEAAAGGNVESVFELGFRSASAGDSAEAIHWYTVAAEAGHDEAMANLAMLLEESGRIPEAIEWYKRAADAGVRNAMYNLALLHKTRGDDEQSTLWFEKAGRAGDTDAMLRVANFHLKAGDLEPAIDWYATAIQAGVTDPRISVTVELLRDAADGDVSAMEELGLTYDSLGRLDLAIVWLSKSAQQGNVKATHNLGIMYEKLGDSERALSCFTEATANGFAESLTGVMRILNQVEQFKAWLIDAIGSDNPVARDFIRKLREDGESQSDPE